MRLGLGARGSHRELRQHHRVAVAQRVRGIRDLAVVVGRVAPGVTDKVIHVVDGFVASALGDTAVLGRAMKKDAQFAAAHA